MKDYFSILNVNKNASLEEIKASYRKLAMKYHPDRCKEKDTKEAEEKFKTIQEAYEFLSNEFKRQELKKELEKQKKKNETYTPNVGINYIIDISSTESLYGCKKPILVYILKTCIKCEGYGKTNIPIGGRWQNFNVNNSPCGECNGEGFKHVSKVINIIIPAGVEDGQKLKVKIGDKIKIIKVNICQ